SVENAPGIDADLAIARELARSIAHEPTGFGKFAQMVDGWKQMTRHKRHDLYATIEEQRIRTDKNCVRSITHERSKGHFNLAASLGFVDGDMESNGFCRRHRVLGHSLCGNRICRIDKERDPRGTRRQLVQ